jgi:putative tricarboxylic transport membrane protein
LPLVIALIIIGLSLMISMKSLSLRREKEIEDILLKKRDRETMNISRVFFYIVLSMFYGLLLDKVGFLITSGLFLIMILRFVEKQTWKMAILVSVTSVTVCYLLFVYFLEVHLPIGFIR